MKARLMSSNTFRLTINGGARVAWGRLEQCAMAAIPLMVAGHTVHLRSMSDRSTLMSVYAQGDYRVARPTRHGEVCDLPEWGRRFLVIVNSVIGVSGDIEERPSDGSD